MQRYWHVTPLLAALATVTGSLISGVPAKEDGLGLTRECPFQVSLHSNGSIICGGTIVDEFHVLTSTTCASQNPQAVKAADQQRQISELFLHPNYFGTLTSHNSFHNLSINDIAVIKVDKPFDLKAKAKLQSLHDVDTASLLQCKACALEAQVTISVSEKYYYSTLSNHICLSRAHQSITTESVKNLLCFENDITTVRPSFVRAGSGVICQGGTLHGIVLMDSRAEEKGYTLATNVDAYVSWIKSVTKEKSTSSREASLGSVMVGPPDNVAVIAGPSPSPSSALPLTPPGSSTVPFTMEPSFLSKSSSPDFTTPSSTSDPSPTHTSTQLYSPEISSTELPTISLSPISTCLPIPMPSPTTVIPTSVTFFVTDDPITESSTTAPRPTTISSGSAFRESFAILSISCLAHVFLLTSSPLLSCKISILHKLKD